MTLRLVAFNFFQWELKKIYKRKHALDQENNQEKKKNFLFFVDAFLVESVFSWASSFFRGRLRVFLFSYFLFFFYKFPAQVLNLLWSYFISIYYQVHNFVHPFYNPKKWKKNMLKRLAELFPPRLNGIFNFLKQKNTYFRFIFRGLCTLAKSAELRRNQARHCEVTCTSTTDLQSTEFNTMKLI